MGNLLVNPRHYHTPVITQKGKPTPTWHEYSLSYSVITSLVVVILGLFQVRSKHFF